MNIYCKICNHQIVKHDMDQFYSGKKTIPCSDCPGGSCVKR